MSDKNNNQLWDLLHERHPDEDAIMSCMNQEPKQCSLRFDEQYPVHIAIDGLLSIEIVEKMISCYPLACKKRDGEGNLLLHHAITYRHEKYEESNHMFSSCKSSDIILSIIDACPSAAQVENDYGYGYLPLHLECNGFCRLDVIIKLLTVFPKAISTTDQKQRFPLHVALCNYQCSSEVIFFLLDQHPDSVRKKIIKDDLPLHIECFTQCRYEVIVKLLELYPNAISIENEVGELPLYKAISNSYSTSDSIFFLIEQHPKAVFKPISDVYGNADNLLIHIECSNNCRYDVILKLLELYPQSIKTTNRQGMLPLHDAMLSTIEDSRSTIAHLIDTFPDAVSTKNAFFQLPLNFECGHQCRYDIIVKLLDIYPEAISIPDYFNQLSLHSAVNRQCGDYTIASDAVLYLISRYPDAVRKVDTFGDLPLHLECSGECRYNVIRKLLETYPDAIRTVDRGGNLPLHRALASNSDMDPDVIMYLINLHPGAVKQQATNTEQPFHVEFSHKCRYDVLKKLLDLDPTALITHAQSKNLPLVAAIQNLKPDVIRMLLDKHPDAVRQISGSCSAFAFFVIFEKYYDQYACVAPSIYSSKLSMQLKALTIEINERYPEAIKHSKSDRFLCVDDFDSYIEYRLMLNLACNNLPTATHVIEYHDFNWKARSSCLYLILQLSYPTSSFDLNLQPTSTSSKLITLISGKKKKKSNPSVRTYKRCNTMLCSVLKLMVAAAGRVDESYEWMEGDDLGCVLLKNVALYL